MLIYFIYRIRTLHAHGDKGNWTRSIFFRLSVSTRIDDPIGWIDGTDIFVWLGEYRLLSNDLYIHRWEVGFVVLIEMSMAHAVHAH